MVVLIINQDRVFAFKLERQAPISTYIHGPMMLQITMQRVESPARSVHILFRLRMIQCEELLAKSLCMFRLNAGLGPGREEIPDSLVTEVLDHFRIA